MQAVAAAAVLVGLYNIAVAWQELGLWIFLLSPVVLGFVLGLFTPPSVTLTLILVPVVVLMALLGLYWRDLGGLACLSMLAPIYVIAALMGALFGGHYRRLRLRRLHALVIAAVALLGHGAYEFVTPRHAETIAIRTTAVVEAPPEVVWRNLHFYEEIDAEPPWLLTIGFPRPVGTEGSRTAVGDVSTCVYEDGQLKKRITERVEARRLAFRIVEQRIHFEHDVELIDGAFDLASTGDGRTRLTLTTRYRPLCYPDWLWRDAEEHVVRTLHEHVIEGIRAPARAQTASRK